MSQSKDYEFLSILRHEYEEENTYLFKIKHMIRSSNEIVKVIDVRKYKRENIENYLKAVRKLNELKSEYLMDYSLIKEENGYIYLVMPEYYGSLEDYDLRFFFYSSCLRGKVSDGYTEIDADSRPISVANDSEIDDSILDFLKNIIEGVKVIHENGYHHGNVSYSNIFAGYSYILSDYCLYLLKDDEDGKKEKRDEGNDEENDEENDDDDGYEIRKEKDEGKRNDKKEIVKIIKDALNKRYDRDYDSEEIMRDLNEDYSFSSMLSAIDEFPERETQLKSNRYTNLTSKETYWYIVDNLDEKYNLYEVAYNYKCELLMAARVNKTLYEENEKLKKEIEELKRKCGDDNNTKRKRKKIAE